MHYYCAVGVYLKTFGVIGTTNWCFNFGTFLAVGQSTDETDTEECVDAVEDEDMLLSLADFLSDSFRSRFLDKETIVTVCTLWDNILFLSSNPQQVPSISRLNGNLAIYISY